MSPPAPGCCHLAAGGGIMCIILVMDGDQAGDQGPGLVTVLVTIAVRKLGLSIITDH